MIIQCDHCQTKYKYDEARFEGKANKKIKCAKCQAVFEIHAPSGAGAHVKDQLDSSGGSTVAHAVVDADDTAAAKARDPRIKEVPRNLDGVTSDADDIEQTGRMKFKTDELAVSRDAANLHLLEDFNYSVAVLDGQDAGKIFQVSKPRVTVGRVGADVALNDTEVSRQHAAIEIHNEHIFLVDLNSTNGTFYSDEKVGTAEISNHSEFIIGSSTLMLIVTPKE